MIIGSAPRKIASPSLAHLPGSRNRGGWCSAQSVRSITESFYYTGNFLGRPAVVGSLNSVWLSNTNTCCTVLNSPELPQVW